MDLQNGHLSEIEVVNNDIYVTCTSILYFWGCRDRMVVGFTTIYAISAYYH